MINCGSACSADFNDGQPVALTAAPAPGSSFAGWSGACQGTGSCNLTMNGDMTVTANFVKAQHTLTVITSNGGHGDITLIANGSTQQCLDGRPCAVSYEEGAVVTVLPNPSAGYGFGGWSGAGCHGLAPCRVTVDGDATVGATFQSSPIGYPNPEGQSCSGSSCTVDNGSSATQTVSCEADVPCGGSTDVGCDPRVNSGCYGASVGSEADALAGPAAVKKIARPLVFMRGHFKIRAHRRGIVRLTLTPAGKRFLQIHKRVKATEVTIIKVHGHRILVARTITLIYRTTRAHGPGHR
jgi:hypothetical protein